VIERLLEAERDLAVGLVDTAEAIYRGLVEADPQNAVAVVGLARCALEHGNERGAYGLAVQALTIDPEDTAALRMEARLSEVLAARGEPVERPAFVQPGEQAGRVASATADDDRGARVRQAPPKRGLLRRMLGRR
jgi:thioredoxin-like negative regulator of GroEL